jgi:alpha-galactosidase
MISVSVLGFVAAASAGPDITGWMDAAFAGGPQPHPRPAPSFTLRRQDYGHLGINESVMATPLIIGRQHFERGLGTHANSEIVIDIPGGNARAFSAFVGIDGNRGILGSVQFMVEIGGHEVFHTATLRGGDEPAAVDVEIPPAATRLVLKVDTTPDGPSSDHADWANAKLLMRDGSTLWLDDLAAQSTGDFWPGSAIPFSFVYGQQSSAQLLTNWPRQTTRQDEADRQTEQTTWIDPKTGLKLTATATTFRDFSAVEWVLRFENTGAHDTPILENVQALDATIPCRPEQTVHLDQIAGDDASERSFVPMESDLPVDHTVALAPVGGRPSNCTFPIFDISRGSRGLFVAIGWTGQWAATLERTKPGPLHLRAGMEQTHLLLHPGESIRTPRILLFGWSGDRMDAHNEFRRLLVAHYLPKLHGKPVQCCVAAQSFNEGPPNWGTEAGQFASAQINHDLGCDTLWMDAGWFQGGFPNGTGNWFPKPVEFPRGLGPVGKECERLGLKFLVWFEPERVCDNTQIAREHPEFVLPVKKNPGAGGLFNLGDPAARRWLTDLLIGLMRDSHIHTYRNDFNMDPLSFWRQNDSPDRQGMTEIRYVEGLYAMWDEFRATFPDMYLDDCASGGRRIDLETMMRSVVQTRSDAAVAPGRSDWHQSQTYGLSLFLPVHATIGWETGAYECRSAATSGFCAEWNILDPHFPRQEAAASIAEINANRKYWSGDYYPLTPWTMSPDQWVSWQLHRPDLDEGLVMAFRHQKSAYSALQVHLRGLYAHHTYDVSYIDEQRNVRRETIPGTALANLELRIPRQEESLLVRYQPARAP